MKPPELSSDITVSWNAAHPLMQAPSESNARTALQPPVIHVGRGGPELATKNSHESPKSPKFPKLSKNYPKILKRNSEKWTTSAQPGLLATPTARAGLMVSLTAIICVSSATHGDTGGGDTAWRNCETVGPHEVCDAGAPTDSRVP